MFKRLFLCLTNEIDFGIIGVMKITDEKEIDGAIDKWHEDKEDDRTLWDVLGWTRDEYDFWLLTGEIPNG
jgi:hypothetical protein